MTHSPFLTAGVALLLSASACAATTYYVSPTGSDASSGMDMSNAWRTIQHSISNAMPGDTVRVGAGRYVERVQFVRSGDTNGPITVAAVPGTTPIIDGETTLPGGHDWQGLLEIVGCHNIVISGLSFFNSSAAGVFIRWATNITVMGCSTLNTWTSGIQCWRSAGVNVWSNDIQYACAGTSGALQECLTIAGATNSDVGYNQVHNRPITQERNGGEGIDAKQGCLDGAIHHNTVNGIAGELAIYVDAYNETLRNVDVHDNKVFDCKNGIVIAAEKSSGYVADVRVFNNLVDGTRRHGIDVSDHGADARKERIDIFNNTCFSNGYRQGTAWGGGISVLSLDVRSVRIFNNLCSHNETWQYCVSSLAEPYVAFFNNGLHSFRDYDGGSEKEVRGTHYVEADPLFVAPDGADFHLLGASPMVNVGTNLLWWPGAVDLDGEQRIYARVVDMGCYEFVPEPGGVAAVFALLCAARRMKLRGREGAATAYRRREVNKCGRG